MRQKRIIKQMTQKNNVKAVDLFDMEAMESSTNFLEKSSFRVDGLYKPSIKDAVDKTKGYCATIRFLPNFLENHTFGKGIIEKEVFYVKVPTFEGYYDCQKPFLGKCPLNKIQWELKQSQNPADVAKAALISYTKKFYSYVLIIEDVQHPELEGKILVFPYGLKIKKKIELQKSGDANDDGEKCNPFDILKGKDFKLIMKEIANFPNYDDSTFKQTSSVLKIWDSKKDKLVPINPTDADVKAKITEFLLSRSVTLEDNEAKPWTAEENQKVSGIISMLRGGQPINIYTQTTATKSQDDHFKGKNDDDDEFFDDIANA